MNLTAAIAMRKSRLVSLISGLLIGEIIAGVCLFGWRCARLYYSSLNELMNDKQDEERQDHEPGEQQGGGKCARASLWARRRLGRAASWEETADPKRRFRLVCAEGRRLGWRRPAGQAQIRFQRSRRAR